MGAGVAVFGLPRGAAQTDEEKPVGKQARDAHRASERAVAREAAAKAGRRRKLLPYWIGAGALVLVLAVAVPVALGGSSTSSLQGLQVFPEGNHKHVTVSVTYDRTPPAGGAHSAVWQNCGIYDQPIQNEHGVHSLEHGAVWITYQPTLSSSAMTQLQAFARDHETGSQGYVLLSPYPGLHSPVVASAWGAQIALDGPGDSRLASFAAKYIGGDQGGETGGECTGGIGTPVA